MRIQVLNSAETDVLEKIAKRSKMSWFIVKIDKDNKMSVMEKDINDLMDGATSYDLETLTPCEVHTLVNILLRCKEIKR